MKKLLLFLGIFVFMPFVFSISMSVNQSEYYFRTGEEAVIPVEIDNDLDKRVSGVFKYTIEQNVNQGGMHYSSTNTQSKSFTLDQGKQSISMGFGTSDQESNLDVSLSFSYDDQIVNLDDIKIYFVSDDSQKQPNNQQKQSQARNEAVPKKEEKSLSEKMQEQMEKVFDDERQQQMQNRVQNNQLSQDSSALKQQMQKQMQEKQEMKEEFEKSLSQNKEFQKMHQDLLKKGYNVSSGNLDPVSNNTGDFEVNYEKDGENAKLEGRMENGSMENIEKRDSIERKKIMEKLSQNEEFKRYDEELKKEGFNRKDVEMQTEKNETKIQVRYNKGNETASINAIAEEEEIKEVELERENSFWWVWLIVMILIVVAGIVVYKRFKRENIKEGVKEEKADPIDYRKEAGKMLSLAKKLFSQKHYKDAYGKSGEAIRFYYSHKFGLGNELTNHQLIRVLKSKGEEYKKTKKCLEMCSLVEFARYKANKKHFDEIVNLAESIIR